MTSSDTLILVLIFIAALAVGYSGFLWAVNHQEPSEPQCPPHNWERYGEGMNEVKCHDCGHTPTWIRR